MAQWEDVSRKNDKHKDSYNAKTNVFTTKHVGPKSSGGSYRSLTPKVSASKGMKDLRKKYGGKMVNAAITTSNRNKGKDHGKKINIYKIK
jgi:hypothetical protein